MTSSRLLEVEGLKTYFFTFEGIAKAVDDVTFFMNRGETLGLVGESGCGKSVTALSVMRLIKEPPGKIVGGKILFDGNDLTRLSLKKMRTIRGNRISMIFQEPMTSLNPVYTVGKQISEMYVIHKKMGARDSRDKAVEMLRQVQIPLPEKRIHEYPHQLSGGMRQRAMIAMALACQPEILIADEPTTALDVTIQAQILELMKNLTRDLGVAMIVITHNLGVVARYADRVNVMYAGKIIESGTASDIYYRPHHPYTLALLKSVPRMDQPRQAKLDPVEGQPPDLTMLDDGCAFRPRCRFATEECAKGFPDLEAVADGHATACFHKEQVVAAMKEAS